MVVVHNKLIVQHFCFITQLLAQGNKIIHLSDLTASGDWCRVFELHWRELVSPLALFTLTNSSLRFYTQSIVVYTTTFSDN